MNDLPKPPLKPVRWKPPANPGLTGEWERNDLLSAGELWRLPAAGPEDVVLTEDGTLYTGTVDGAILEVSHQGKRVREVANTGGRPLGIELYGDRLLVSDAHRGLVAVDPDGGQVEDVVTHVDGQRLAFVNNAAVGSDGTIWFTDSSRRFPIEQYRGDLIEHSCTGRFLRRDPDGAVTTLLDDMCFSNGVALDPDERFVLVAETGTYRILKHWLSGDRAGSTEVFAEMPGFPDNLSTGPTGTFWCAVANQRNRLLDALLPLPAVIRKAVWTTPEWLQPGVVREAIVFGYDADGNLTHNLQWHDGDFVVCTGVREHDGWLYLGSLESEAVLRFRL